METLRTCVNIPGPGAAASGSGTASVSGHRRAGSAHWLRPVGTGRTERGGRALLWALVAVAVVSNQRHRRHPPGQTSYRTGLAPESWANLPRCSTYGRLVHVYRLIAIYMCVKPAQLSRGDSHR